MRTGAARHHVGRRIGRTLAAAVVLALLAGCAMARNPDRAPDEVPMPTRTVTSGQPADGGPEPFHLIYGDTQLTLWPRSWGMDSGASGSTDAVPYDLGEVEVVYLMVGEGGWSGNATQFTGKTRESCDERQLSPDVEDLAGDWMKLTLAGPAGRYSMDLTAGSGPGGGLGQRIGSMDATVTFTLPADGPHADGTAFLMPLSTFEGKTMPGGIGLDLMYLREKPTNASATLTITAGDGATTTRDFPVSPWGCPDLGTISFLILESDAAGLEDLGPAPYRYDVEMVLDGTTHRATVTPPIAETDNSNAFEMEFTPALP